MATEVKVPTLGESISSGIIATWHVKSGDVVSQGQALYDLETDKITSEGTAEVAGKIELKAEEGDEVEVGSVIAMIDESVSEKESGDSEKESGDGSRESEDSEQESGDGSQESEEVAEKPKAKEVKGEAQHPASVRRIANESGVDPNSVEGTGKDGRVTKEDMTKAASDSKKKEAPASPPKKASESSPSKTQGERESRRKLTPLRKTIANRLVQAQQMTAMLTTFNEVDMSAVMELRKKHQDRFVDKHGVKLGFMSFFAQAVVHALKAVPALNARLEDNELVENHYYDIGIAVSTPKGLMVPVVRDCDSLSFADTEKTIIEYAKKAKDGKIGIADLQGGVFTITNGGIFGSMLSTPILNYPQSGILGMHTIQQRPMAVNGEVVIRPMMYLALSYDHRIVDGREAVTFLVHIKQSIEDPSRLLFDL